MPYIEEKARARIDGGGHPEAPGELNYDVPAISDVVAQDLCDEAYRELRARKDLDEEFQRLKVIEKRWGY
jgi:hypothetical protein